MGDKWVTVRKAAHDGTLRQSDPEARAIAERWEQFTQYLCLGLSQDLGRSVSSQRPRSQTTSGRLDELTKALAVEGALDAVLRIPDAVGDLRLRVDLRARQTLTSVTVDAPREGRVTSRINWLLRQLGEAPNDLRVEVAYPNARETTSVMLSQALEDATHLLYPSDLKREPRSFILTLVRPMGSKRGKAEGSFVRETRGQTFDFYRDLVQNLKLWQPRPPKLRELPEPTDVPESFQADPPPFVDAGEREVGAASDPSDE
jgi:hypothetical protein